VKRWMGAFSAASLLITSAGCGLEESADGSSGEKATTLTVYAAASLTETFTEMGEQFEADHEGVHVRFSFGGSSGLVAQLQQGAPADVLASADTASMDKAIADGLVEGDPVDFATNTLEIAVPPDNPAEVKSLQDLSKSGTRLVVCAPEVPCGAATEKVEQASGVKLQPVSEEQSVTDVLNKVQTGEADAGLVYATDVLSAGAKITGITFPESSSAVNTYPIGSLADSKNQGLAQEFVDVVTGGQGQRILADAGFAKP